MKVLIDTTVLCAAMRKPDGLCMELLQLARIDAFEPILSEEIVAEWVRNCRRGLGRGRATTVFTEEDLDDFCRLLEPLLNDENVARVRIGRAASPAYPIRQEEGYTLIQVPMGAQSPASGMLDPQTIGIKDIGDVHVVEAALRYGCSYLCTANVRDFPDGLRLADAIEVIRPERLLRLLVD